MCSFRFSHITFLISYMTSLNNTESLINFQVMGWNIFETKLCSYRNPKHLPYPLKFEHHLVQQCNLPDIQHFDENHHQNILQPYLSTSHVGMQPHFHNLTRILYKLWDNLFLCLARLLFAMNSQLRFRLQHSTQ